MGNHHICIAPLSGSNYQQLRSLLKAEYCNNPMYPSPAGASIAAYQSETFVFAGESVHESM
jgi:hypothetical protein